MFHLQTLIRDGAYRKPVSSRSKHSLNSRRKRSTSIVSQIHDDDDESTIKTEIGGPIVRTAAADNTKLHAASTGSAQHAPAEPNSTQSTPLPAADPTTPAHQPAENDQTHQQLHPAEHPPQNHNSSLQPQNQPHTENYNETSITTDAAAATDQQPPAHDSTNPQTTQQDDHGHSPQTEEQEHHQAQPTESQETTTLQTPQPTPSHLQTTLPHISTTAESLSNDAQVPHETTPNNLEPSSSKLQTQESQISEPVPSNTELDSSQDPVTQNTSLAQKSSMPQEEHNESHAPEKQTHGSISHEEQDSLPQEHSIGQDDLRNGEISPVPAQEPESQDSQTTQPHSPSLDHAESRDHAQSKLHLSLDSLVVLRIIVIQILLSPYFDSLEHALEFYFTYYQRADPKSLVLPSFSDFLDEFLLLRYRGDSVSMLYSELTEIYSSQLIPRDEILHMMQQQIKPARALIDLFHNVLRDFNSLSEYENSLPLHDIDAVLCTNTLTHALQDDVAALFRDPFFTMSREHLMHMLYTVDHIPTIVTLSRLLEENIRTEHSENPTLFSTLFSHVNSHSTVTRIELFNILSNIFSDCTQDSAFFIFNKVFLHQSVPAAEHTNSTEPDHSNLFCIKYDEFMEELCMEHPHLLTQSDADMNISTEQNQVPSDDGSQQPETRSQEQTELVSQPEEVTTHHDVHSANVVASSEPDEMDQAEKTSPPIETKEVEPIFEAEQQQHSMNPTVEKDAHPNQVPVSTPETSHDVNISTTLRSTSEKNNATKPEHVATEIHAQTSQQQSSILPQHLNSSHAVSEDKVTTRTHETVIDSREHTHHEPEPRLSSHMAADRHSDVKVSSSAKAEELIATSPSSKIPTSSLSKSTKDKKSATPIAPEEATSSAPQNPNKDTQSTAPKAAEVKSTPSEDPSPQTQMKVPKPAMQTSESNPAPSIEKIHKPSLSSSHHSVENSGPTLEEKTVSASTMDTSHNTPISPSKRTEKKYLPGTAPESALHVAARNGDLDSVRDLLQRGVIYRRTVDGISPLWLACQEGHYEIANELIISGADVNEPSNTGTTPLIVASQYGHAPIVRLLLETGANVNARQNTYETALMVASEEGHAEVVQELLAYNALVNAHDNDGVTALHISSLFGHIEVVRELIAHNASLNERDNDGSTALFLACEAGHLECVKALIEGGASPLISDHSNVTCLHVSSQEGCSDIVKYLLQHDCDPNIQTEEGTTPLILAVQEGHDNVVQELLHYGANPDTEHKGVPPLIVATHRGHDSIIRLLCNAGVNVNCRLRTGETPLFIASERGFLEGVRVLLQYKADPNCGSAEIGTPLFVACYKGHVKIVRELIRYEADLEYAEPDGTTALIMAVETSNVEVVRELVKAYANVNAFTTTNGNAPLHIVAQRGDLAMAKILTNGGTNVNQQNTAGDTPLIIAVRCGHYDLAQFLLNFSAHINKCNKMGETALFAASQQEDLKIFRLLIRKRYGADINIPLRDGTTILSKACADGNFELVRLIIEVKLNSVSYPADLNKIGQQGMTPLQHAVKNGHIEIVKLLLLAGAEIDRKSENGEHAVDLTDNDKIKSLLNMHSDVARKDGRPSASISPKGGNSSRAPNMYIALAKHDDGDDASPTPEKSSSNGASKKMQVYDSSLSNAEGSYILKAPSQRFRGDNYSNDSALVSQFTSFQKQIVDQFSFQNQQLMSQTSELKLQMQQQLHFQQEQMKLQTKQMEILDRLSERVSNPPSDQVNSQKLEHMIEKKLDSVLGRLLQNNERAYSPKRTRSPKGRHERRLSSDSRRSASPTQSMKLLENLDDKDVDEILDSIPTPRKFSYNDPPVSPRREEEGMKKRDETSSEGRNPAVPRLSLQEDSTAPHSDAVDDTLRLHSMRAADISAGRSMGKTRKNRYIL